MERDGLTEYGRKVKELVCSYDLLYAYYEVETGYINIPLEDYIGNIDIIRSVTDIMLNGSMEYLDGSLLCWYMLVVEGDKYRGSSEDTPLVSLSLVNYSDIN